MGGWFLDILIEWLVWMIAQTALRLRNLRWPVVEARITNAQCPQAHYGRHVADVRFDYAFEGVEYGAYHEEPFLIHGVGEDWARGIRIGSQLKVRVNPRDPQQTAAIVG